MVNNKRQGKNAGPTINSLNSKIDRVMKMIPKGTFRNVGGKAGMALGGPVGSAVGQALGSGISAITGYGDYVVKSNSLGTVSTSVDMVPQFLRNDHSVRVTHREFVTDLAVPDMPAEFVNRTFVINPGNIKLFPWLASLARQYQTYLIHGMIVEFKSMSSDYAAAGPLGTVAIATNYNVNDLPFDNKIALENSEFAVSSKPSRSIIHAIECEPEVNGSKYRYVRDAGNQSSALSDARMYDLGLLQVATAGLPGSAGSTLGEMWVSYDIEFSKPVLPSSDAPPPPGPTAINASILVSQPSGITNFVNGQIGRIVYTQASQPALTADETTLAFEGTLANITKQGDTDLDGTVVEVEASGALTIKKDGVYTVSWRSFATTSNGKTHYGDKENTVVQTAATATGSASAQVDAYGTGVRHYMSEYDTKSMGTWTYRVLVTGCGSDGGGGTIRLACPGFVASDTGLAVPTTSTLTVDWLQSSLQTVVIQ